MISHGTVNVVIMHQFLETNRCSTGLTSIGYVFGVQETILVNFQKHLRTLSTKECLCSGFPYVDGSSLNIYGIESQTQRMFTILYYQCI